MKISIKNYGPTIKKESSASVIMSFCEVTINLNITEIDKITVKFRTAPGMKEKLSSTIIAGGRYTTVSTILEVLDVLISKYTTDYPGSRELVKALAIKDKILARIEEVMDSFKDCINKNTTLTQPEKDRIIEIEEEDCAFIMIMNHEETVEWGREWGDEWEDK